MKSKANLRRFSITYLRFKRQLTALEDGRLRTVKKLAREAQEELILKRQACQLSLGLNL